MSNIVAVLIVRCTHTGVYADGRPNRGSVTLYDLDEITISKVRTRYVPIPPGSSVDVPMSTRALVSWHEGDICKLTRLGLITSELILQLRDKSHCGGATGDGQSLQTGVLNIERVNNVLRMVIPDVVLPNQGPPVDLGSVGFLAGEPLTVSGLTDPNFRRLNGDYVLSTVTPGTGLAGASVGSYLIEMPSEGPDIPAITHPPGVNLCLSEGRVTSQFNATGNVGGLGSDVFGYIAGMLLPTAGTGGGGGSTILVQDEGVALANNPFTTLNFIGTGVLADNGAPGVANIFIPPPSFLSHWNTSDGSNGNQAVSESISRTTVRISTPAGGEGTPFFTNGWAGTNQPASINGVVTNTTPGNTTGFGGDSTMTVTVYSADGSTVLDSYTTPFIVGNAVLVSPSGRITVTITGFGADTTRFQANASVATNIDGVFVDNGLEGGRYHIEVTHTTDTATDGTGPYTYVQSDVFYDDNPTTPSIGGTVTIGETAGGQVVKHLSGLEYYILGSQFTVDVNDLDQMNRDTQRIPTNLTINGPEYGLPTLNQAGFGAGAANFSGWTNNHNQDNIDYQNAAWAITANNYRYLGPTANVSSFPQDAWNNGATVNSANASVLIDTFGVNSTALFRDYNDESRRQTEDMNGGAAAGNWTSTDDLNGISYAATGVIRVLTAPLTAGDSFTIGATVFTGVAGPRTPGANDFDASLGTLAALQTEIEDAINDPANGAFGTLFANIGILDPSGADVRVTAATPGSAGNALSLMTNAPTRIAVTDTTLLRGGVPAQVWNSRLVVPSSTTLVRSDGPNSANADWTGYSPTTLGANPDYTTLVAPAISFETFEDTSGLFRSSGQFVFSGSFAGANALADLISGDLQIWVVKRAGSVGNAGPLPVNTRPLMLHGAAYNFATFDDGLTDGQIREATSAGNTINFTFGGFSMLNGIQIAVQINDPDIQIDSITATFF